MHPAPRSAGPPRPGWLALPRWLGWSLILAVTVSCSPARHSAGADPTPSVTLPAPIEVAYSGFWHEWTAANASLDYDHTRLTQYTDDPLLQTLTANLETSRRMKEVSRGEIIHRITALENDQDTNRITDCIEITNWRLYDSESGSPLPGQIPGKRTQQTVIVMRLQGTNWKATNMYVYGQC